MITSPFLFAIGLHMLATGAAGYERYMLQNDAKAASFDLGILFIGTFLIWYSITA